MVPEKKVGWVGHTITYMGTGVPAKVALSPQDVAGVNIVA